MNKRLISRWMVLCMLLSLLPAKALAAGDNTAGTEESNETAEMTNVYVYAQVVDSSPEQNPVTNAVGLRYNRGTNWMTLGWLPSYAALPMAADTVFADPAAEPFCTVLAELENSGQFTPYTRNGPVSLSRVDWFALKYLHDWHDGHKGEEGDENHGRIEAYHLDGRIVAYQIRFDANAGSDTVSGTLPVSGYYLDGTEIALPIVTRKGYTLTGWKVTDGAGSETVIQSSDTARYTAAADVTITAQWEKTAANVYVYAQVVDSSPEQNPVTNAVGLRYNRGTNWVTLGWLPSYAALPMAADTAYTDPAAEPFCSVLTELENSGRFTPYTRNGPVSLSRVDWFSLKYQSGRHDGHKGEEGDEDHGSVEAYHLDGRIVAYQIRFDANAGSDAVSGMVPVSGYYLDGTEIPLPVLERENYTLIGWKVTENAAGSETVIQSSGTARYTAAADVTITAQWTETTHTLRFDPNGGSVSPEFQQVAYGQPYGPLPVPVRAGYRFGGWYLGDTEVTAEDTAYLTEDTVLLARWTAEPIVLDLNGYVWKEYHQRYNVKDKNAVFTFTAVVCPDAGDNRSRAAAPEADGGAPLAAVTGTVTISSSKSGQAESVVFDRTAPLDAGRYQILVREDPVSRSDVTCDGSVYLLHMELSDNGATGLEARLTGISKVDAQSGVTRLSPETDRVTFINFYSRALTDDVPAQPAAQDHGLTLNKTEHFAYVHGYPDGTIRPEEKITRAEAAAILYRIMTPSCAEAYQSDSSSYSDVTGRDWFHGYVATLERAGVIRDTPAGGLFRPNEYITRAELTVMLAQFAPAESGTLPRFSDVAAQHWAAGEISLAAKLGWIRGYPDGSFRPEQTVTRGEMMAMINRALERRPGSAADLLPGMKVWSDNQAADKWYYLDVQEASNSHTYTKTGEHETWTQCLTDPAR